MPSLVTSRTERAWQANLASPLTPSTADLKCASALAPSCVSAAARPSVLWIPETSSCAIILLSQPHDLARFTRRRARSEEHTSELQSLMRISYAVFCLKKKKQKTT